MIFIVKKANKIFGNELESKTTQKAESYPYLVAYGAPDNPFNHAAYCTSKITKSNLALSITLLVDDGLN